MLVVIIVAVVSIVGVGILGAGYIRNGVDRASAHPEQAYRAATGFVTKQPGLKGPVAFAPMADSVVEQWSPGRYRVTGRAEARDDAGKPVRLLYSCVVERDQKVWALDDISVQMLK